MKVPSVIGIATLAVVLVGPLLVAFSGTIRFDADWRTADRSSAGIAPDPAQVREAVVQVYAARAFNWRGIFAVHTWVSTKLPDAEHYRVHQVVGWRLYDDLPVVQSEEDIPDRNWYAQPPEILIDLRGAEAEALIADIEAAVQSYPYPRTYRLWPGPNSNTFVAWIARRVPALKLDLPPTAIGKDFLGGWRVFGPAPSGTGYELSLYGLLSVTVARMEGLEINILGASFGANPFKLQLRLPGLGVVGAD